MSHGQSQHRTRRDPGLTSAFTGPRTSTPALVLMLGLGLLLLGYAGQGLGGEPGTGLTITYVAMTVAGLALLAGGVSATLRKLRARR